MYIRDHPWYKDNRTSHNVPRVTATHSVNSSLYTRVLYISLYAVSLYKTQGDVAQQCHMTLALFPAAVKGVGGRLCFIWLFPFLCLPSLKSRCWDMLSGSGCKGRMEPTVVWGGGLVVSLPTDQITAGISSSVSIRSKEVNPPGSTSGKKCDNSNGHAPFAFKCDNFLPFNSI